MSNDDRNRTSADKEPERDKAPADRSGQPTSYPGGYGPAQGQNEKTGNAGGTPKSPPREH
jgi:hypothetical protein